MRFLKYAFFFLFFVLSFSAYSSDIKIDTIKPIRKSDKEWKESLSPQAYYILRKAGTERAFTGKLYNIKTK
jgi:peptide-methionine (R)-S-oxide reductase